MATWRLLRGVAESMGLSPCFTIIAVREGMAPYVSVAEAEPTVITTRSMLNPRGYWATVCRQDCIIDIGGGDSFTDIYGSKRFAFIWGTKVMAIAAGRPLMLCPQTIGPVNRRLHTALAAFAVRHSEVVVTRDRASLVATEALAPGSRCVLSADVAFALPYDSHAHLRGGKTLRVGINISGLLFNEAMAGTNRFGLDANYAELMRKLIAWLQETGAEVHLFAHVRTIDQSWDDDACVTDQLAQEFPNTIRVPDFDGPCEAKSYISGLDFVVSARMHACIAAVSSGTPVVPIAYSRKFSVVFGVVGYPWLIDTTGKTTDEALAYIEDCIARRDQLATDCLGALERAGPFLDVYHRELKDFLAKSKARQGPSGGSRPESLDGQIEMVERGCWRRLDLKGAIRPHSLAPDTWRRHVQIGGKCIGRVHRGLHFP